MRNKLYRWVTGEVTDHCYKNSLNYFSPGATVLDVGIGNGLMMRNYHGLIKRKGLKIIGIDINQVYLDHCREMIDAYGLKDNVFIHRIAIEDYAPPQTPYFDFVFFSMSFMLLGDQQEILERVKSWLKPGGAVVFFQTIFQKRSTITEFVKPRLKYLTSIEFGRVTYEREFYALLNRTGLVVVEDRLIRRKWFKGEYRMLVAVPVA